MPSKRSLLALACLFIAIPIALYAQDAFLTPIRIVKENGWLYFAIAAFLFSVGLWLTTAPFPAQTIHSLSQSPPFITYVKVRLFLVGLAGIFAFFAYQQFDNNTFTRWGVLYWTTAILLWLLALAGKPRFLTALPHIWQQKQYSFTLKPYHLALIAIFLIALFFRVYHLDITPYEMTSDHAEKLLDVYDVLEGKRPIFFPRNTGREAFQFYLTALLIWTTPLTLSHLALKVGTAIISLVALPFTYLLGKELYNHRLGVVAMLFLSFSHWHVAISRVGLRFPFTATFATPTLLYLIRALRHNRRNDWLLAGIFLGVGLHTYIPMRIVPPLLVVLVLLHAGLQWWQKNPVTRDYWLNAVLSALTSALIFLPLLRYMWDNPDMFWLRVTTRSSDALEKAGILDTLAIFWQNVQNAALMFNVKGDVVYANTVPNSPVLGWVTAALFILGIVTLLYQLIRLRDRRPLYLGLMLFFLMLPSMLSIAFPGENPSVVRTGGAIPIVMIIAALPLWLFWEMADHTLGKLGTTISLLLITFLLLFALPYNYNWYFNRYHNQYRLSAWNARQMAAVVKGFNDSVGDFAYAYHIPYPHWVDTRAIAINAGSVGWYQNTIVDVPGALEQHTQTPSTKLYLLHRDDYLNLAYLQTAYPQGIVTRHYSAVGYHKDFLTFFVPPPPPQ